jgi:PAS domain S-box-containing protein
VEGSRDALSGMERDARELRNRVQAKTREVQQAKEYARKLLAERDELRSWRGLAEKELAAAAVRRDELEKQLDDEHREVDALRRRLEAETGDADQLREALDAGVREAHALHEQLDAQAAELGRAHAERDRLVINLRESEAARANVTQALEDARAEVAAGQNGRSGTPPEDVLASNRAMAILDADGRIERANAALAALIGLPAGRLEGFSLPELVHDAEAAEVGAGLKRFAEGNLRRVSARQRLLRARGGPLEARLSLSVVRHAGGVSDFLLEVEPDAAAQAVLPALAAVSG